MTTALRTLLPPTATVVDDTHDYDIDDPFAAVANAADAEMVEVLIADMEFGDDDFDPADYRMFVGL